MGGNQGLTTALGVCLAVLAALAAGADDPWWAAISAWMVAHPDRSAQLAKGVMRCASTLAGCVLGIVAAQWLADLHLLQLLTLFAAGALGIRKRFAGGTWSYAWFLGALTFSMMTIYGMTQPDALWELAQYRVIEIVCGVVAAGIASTMLATDAQLHPAAVAAAQAQTSMHDFGLDRITVIGGLVPVMMILIWSIFDLPSVVQMVVSSFAVLDRDIATAEVRGWQRLLGCLVGAVAGLAAIAVVGDVLPLWLFALSGGIFLFARVHHGGGSAAYVGTQAGIAFIMAMITGSGPPATILPALDRLAGIVLGVGIVMAVSLAVSARRPPASTTRPPTAAEQG
jgi:uncharacterized membrane protein YccC